MEAIMRMMKRETGKSETELRELMRKELLEMELEVNAMKKMMMKEEEPKGVNEPKTKGKKRASAKGASVSVSAKGASMVEEKEANAEGVSVVSAVEGNKLTIDFDKAGEKRVIDSFVTRA